MCPKKAKWKRKKVMIESQQSQKDWSVSWISEVYKSGRVSQNSGGGPWPLLPCLYRITTVHTEREEQSLFIRCVVSPTLCDCINVNFFRFHYHHHHHHHQVTPSARISLTLFRHPSLSSIASGWSSGIHPVSPQSNSVVVLPLLVLVKGSTGVHYLWVRPYFSNLVPHAWFV